MNRLLINTSAAAVLAASLAIANRADAIASFSRNAVAQESAAAHDARMKWWREARFGMFVHWGLYSGLAGTWEGKPAGTSGGMEWIQQYIKVDTETYARVAKSGCVSPCEMLTFTRSGLTTEKRKAPG